MSTPITRLVDVAVPVPIFKTFTYAVPDRLIDLVQIGSRVSVPFGKRTMTGIVIDEIGASDLKRIRPINDLLDDTPLFTEEMLKLAEWMSSYYLSPLGETLRAMLPQGMTPASAQVVMLLNDPDDEELAMLRRRAPRQSAIIAALRDHPKGVKVSFLQKKVGAEGLASQLTALEEKGIIARATSQGEGVKEKRKKAIRIADWLLRDEEALRETFDQLDKLAPKQSAILSYLYGRGGDNDASVLLSDVLEKTGASSPAATSLQEKGVIVVEEIEVSRESILEELDSIGIVDRYEGEFVANADQQKAIDAIVASLPDGFTPFLLHGVTGSGKTHVYIEALKATIANGRKGLLLVPEIALTVQLVERFKAVFGDRIVLLHSRMTEGERYDGWKRSAAGDCDLVIGPRSALFAPLRNIGLIVVDEEHESSYKQYDAQPRYNARDAAVIRARIEGAVVVMGSATPSIESFHNAGTGKYRLLELPQRVDGALEPKMVLVDTQSARKQNMMRGSLSTLLIKSIRERIAKSEGTILFQNRRGFSTRLECTNCAHSPNCPNCSVTLTFHKGIEQLRCHYCGYNRPRENECEVCGSHDLRQPGIGTQRVEEELKLELPEARVCRMDLDTTSRKGAHKRMLAEFGRGEIDVLLGTQMVAKGLDFPRVSLVGVVSADTQLMLPDFRSGERTFQLITQVAGRAGRRSETPGEVIIQTGHPDHPAIVNAFAKDYRNMVDDEIRTRRELNYPPFARFILIEFRSKDQKDAETHARKFRDLLPMGHAAFEILGPTAALIWKLRNLYRYQIIVKNIKSKDPGGSIFTRLYTEATEKYNQTIGSSSVEMIVDVDAYGTI